MPYPYLIQCDPVSGCGKHYPGDLEKCSHCGCPVAFSDDAGLMLNPLDYTYDIETYPEIFTVAFTHISSGSRWKFEISPRINQIDELIALMFNHRDIGARHVGFNNVGFDYPVMHFIITHPKATYTQIYDKAMAIIESLKRNDQFAHSIGEKNRVVEQLDLYLLMHFNNKAKATSLKHLEFNMRMNNIEDLPFELGSILNDAQKDILHAYNGHDVEATTRFYIRVLDHIKLREELTAEYGVNMINFSNTKIGATILTTELEKAGIQCYQRVDNRKRPLQTPRATIALNEVIFPYVKFTHPKFAFIKNYLDSMVITETKGSLHDIDVTDWPEGYACTDKSLWPSTFSVKINKKTGRLMATNLHVFIDGCLYMFGTGGLHMSVVSKDEYSDDDSQIVDVDVASFYPKLAIVNNMYPAHLGPEYCPIYDGIYNRRKSYPKSSPLNKALKEALNASYGNSNNAYSPLYDPFYTMQTTINGQLLLCMLVEQLLLVPGLSMIQCNTDGVTYKVPRAYLNHTRQICKWWENFTSLELEEALYKRMIIRNVNNYIACYENGDVKRKGAYGYDKDWSQDASALVIPKAAEAALLHGTDIGDFIRGHGDVFDFCIKAKVPRSNKLMLEWSDLNVSIQLGNIIRYFVSTSGGSLVKVSPPKAKEGTWKRKAKVDDKLFERVLGELNSQVGQGDAGGQIWYDNTSDVWRCYDTDDVIFIVDADGVPHDERIHTKNKSKHTEGRTGINASETVIDCSDITNFDRSMVNYDYYIAEAHKIVDDFKKCRDCDGSGLFYQMADTPCGCTYNA